MTKVTTMMVALLNLTMRMMMVAVGLTAAPKQLMMAMPIRREGALEPAGERADDDFGRCDAMTP